MSAISLETAKTQLQRYLDAETAVLMNQSYEIAGRKLQRADLEAIRQGIQYWTAQVEAKQADAEASGSGRSSRLGRVEFGF